MIMSTIVLKNLISTWRKDKITWEIFYISHYDEDDNDLCCIFLNKDIVWRNYIIVRLHSTRLSSWEYIKNIFKCKNLLSYIN